MGVRTSYQSRVLNEHPGESPVTLTSLITSCLRSWIFLFLPWISAGGRRSLGLDLATRRAECVKTSLGLFEKSHKIYLPSFELLKL